MDIGDGAVWSCSCSARVHEGHGPAGTSSPRASDHAGGRLGVEVESARLDDALREVATPFLLIGAFCVNVCGRRLSGKVELS